MLSALVISPGNPIFVKIFQTFRPILQLRLTHIRCYNEKVEVLASLGPQLKPDHLLATLMFEINNLRQVTPVAQACCSEVDPHAAPAPTC